MFHSTYFGCNIMRSNSPGPSLRWTAMTPNGQAAADTLGGVRDAIKERLGIKPRK